MATTTKEENGYSVAKLRKQYLDFTGTKSAEIEEQRLARHYYHGDQYTKGELATLLKRRQPPVTANRIGRKIDGVVGLVERMRQDPKAFNRTPPPEQPPPQQGMPPSPPKPDPAETATAVIRYTLDANEWQAISSESARSASINGIGGLEMSLEKGDHSEQDPNDREVKLGLLDVDTFFYDPRSVRLDFSDARYMGAAKWIDLEVAKEMFPDSDTDLDALVSTGGADSVQLQDREKAWVDTDKKRLFLIEHWYVWKGEWRYCFYVADQELQSGDSPFKDEKGKTIARFIMFSSNVDHDGDRYGFVRNMKSIQDEVNARRSKGLHLLNTRRIIMTDGAVQDIEKTRAEAARSDGVVVVNPQGDGGRFEFDDQSRIIDMKGQVEFLAEAKAEIENFAFNPSLIGTGVQDMSGRAIQLQQQAGMAELGPYILAYRNWKIRVYRAVWSVVQQYWTAERWIRVTDEDALVPYLQLNALQMGVDGQMTMANHLGALDVDIVIDEGPDTITMMQDTYDTMAALAKGGLQVPPEVLIELSPADSKTKKRVLEMLEKAKQVDPAKQKLEMDNAQATVGALKGKGMRDMAAAMKDFAEIEMLPHQGQDQPAPVEDKGPSQSISYKDLPPEGQSQMAEQAGIHLHPAVLAAHAANVAQQQTDQANRQAAFKAAVTPKPKPASHAPAR